MNTFQPRTKAPHTGQFHKMLVPDDIRIRVVRINRSIPDTAKILGVSNGSVEELKNIGGALKASVIDQVRARLDELDGVSA